MTYLLKRISILSVTLLIFASCAGSTSSEETPVDASEETPVEASEETPVEIEDEAPPTLASDELAAEISEKLQIWLLANGAPGSSVSVLLPDGSQVNVAEGDRD